jgi:hypothetical protein
MKKSPEMLRAYLSVSAAKVSNVQTSRILGISEDLIYQWTAASRRAQSQGDNPSEWFFSYPDDDDEPRWFHELVRATITASVGDIEAAARQRARDGVFTDAKFQGRTVYKQDPELINQPDLVELLGLPDDLLRINGKLVPEQTWVPPATDLVLGILAAHSRTYSKRSTVDLNVNARVNGGVKVIPMFAPPPPAIEAPLPVLEILQSADAVTDTDP